MAFADKKAAFAYVNEYQKEKYDRITVMAGKGKKEKYQTAAKAAGMSLSAFIEMCVDEKIIKGQFKYAIIVLSDEASKSDNAEREVGMDAMTNKQVRFLTWLITTATDKCTSIEEVHELNQEIRKYSDGLIDLTVKQDKDIEQYKERACHCSLYL